MMPLPYPPFVPGIGSIVSIPAAKSGTKTTSSQTVASISTQSCARGSAPFAPAANPKCPAITASAVPSLGFWPGNEPGVKNPNQDDEDEDSQEKRQDESFTLLECTPSDRTRRLSNCETVRSPAGRAAVEPS